MAKARKGWTQRTSFYTLRISSSSGTARHAHSTRPPSSFSGRPSRPIRPSRLHPSGRCSGSSSQETIRRSRKSHFAFYGNAKASRPFKPFPITCTEAPTSRGPPFPSRLASSCPCGRACESGRSGRRAPAWSGRCSSSARLVSRGKLVSKRARPPRSLQA